jgi:UPF0755 protein
MKRLIALLLLFVVALGGAAYFLYGRVLTPYRGYAADAQDVEIASGLGTAAIGQRLVAAGVVRDALSFRAALWLSGDAKHLQAGEYHFDRPMTAREVIDKIARGDVDRITVTFPEGLTIAEMSKIFESAGLGTAASFVAAARDVSQIQSIDAAATDLEGYLFPETYAVPRRIDAAPLVRLMVQQFGKVVTPDVQAAALAHGWTVRQLVTLASIVEKETSRPDERPIVAGVYANRLRIGMGLQCDPTVIYALLRANRYTGNLRRDDLSFDSPYNTYRYRGLPPGPIASPGRTSLEAAAQPAANDYLYFVSRNDGSHAFAKTLDEHNRNVQKYQVEYFRKARQAR